MLTTSADSDFTSTLLEKDIAPAGTAHDIIITSSTKRADMIFSVCLLILITLYLIKRVLSAALKETLDLGVEQL